MKRILNDFKEGFVGAFVLAGAIVMAVVSVATAFAQGGIDAVKRDGQRTSHS